jgi:hypothetical protein
MRFLVGLSDEVMIINHGEKLYQGSAEGLSKDRQVVDVYLGEGTSARLGIVPEDKRWSKRPTTTFVPEGDAGTALAKDGWSEGFTSARQNAARQDLDGRAYEPDEENRAASIARAARDLIDARRKEGAGARKDASRAPGQGKPIDPVTFEVLRNMFEYACERMTTVMQRTSFSPILADMLDFSNSLLKNLR